MKRQKDKTMNDELPRLASTQYATGDQIIPERMKRLSQSKSNNPVVDVTGDGSKVHYYKEQYCIGTWNGRPMNQGKLEVVK